MAPIAELIRFDGTVAKSLRFVGDVKVESPDIFVNTEDGHKALSSLLDSSSENTLRITEDENGIVADSSYVTHSIDIPPQTDIKVHHENEPLESV